MTAAATSVPVALVVLNWNGKDDTLRCLASLDRASYRGLRVIVVDNGSTDGSSAAILEAHPGVELLRLASNRGYTGGNNAGIARALESDAEIIGVLNNDTVVDPGFLEPLVEQIEHDHMAYVSPRIVYLDEPDHAWFGGSYLDPKVGITYHQSEDAMSSADRTATVRQTAAVTGCCLLAHRELWERVGLFDDRYFLMFEDADWCARAGKAGAHALVVTSSNVAHAVGASFRSHRSTIGDYYYLRNGLLYLREHGDARIRCSMYLVGRVIRASVRSFLRDPNLPHAQSAIAQIEGATAFVLRRFGPRADRRRHAPST
jgi:hypothetical protein